jgi:hypothetical protein
MFWARDGNRWDKEFIYRILVGKLPGKRPLGMLTIRGEDNIKLDLSEIDCEDSRWMELAENCAQGELWY